jgi:Uma2 family endonuclease
MAVGSLVSVAEYLNTSYRPDRDYVDGEVRERNLGEFEHGNTQARILIWLGTHYPQLMDRLAAEQRVQVRQERFRIPDVCVASGDEPREQIIRTPPTLCVEILSKDDRMAEIMERADDYFRMGVPVCWIIEPVKRRGWVATPEHLFEPADGILRAGDLEMPLAAVLRKSIL